MAFTVSIRKAMIAVINGNKAFVNSIRPVFSLTSHFNAKGWKKYEKITKIGIERTGNQTNQKCEYSADSRL